MEWWDSAIASESSDLNSQSDRWDVSFALWIDSPYSLFFLAC